MMNRLLLSLFAALRRLLYNTPIRHWRITAVIASQLARLVAGKSERDAFQINFKGIQLIVPTKDTMMVPSLLAQTYEEGTLAAFREEVRRIDALAPDGMPGYCFVDVGANLGLYSILTSLEAVRHGVWAEAFEPDPETFRFLTRNLALNSCNRVTTHQLAVSRSPGMGKLDNTSPLLGCHHLTDAEEGIPVSLTSLDAFFADDMTRVKLIKIDVEGHEPDVIAGATELIRQAKPTVFMEFVSQHLRRSGHDPEEFLERLIRIFPSVGCIDELTGKVRWILAERSTWPGNIMSVGANLILRH